MAFNQDSFLKIKPGIGLSQVLRRQVKDQISLRNLQGFLVTIGWIINYEFDQKDWNDILRLLKESDIEPNQTCEYELIGTHCARLLFTKVDHESVLVDINLPVELMPQVRLAFDIFSTFTLSI